jgi:hypothetical protein
MRENDSQVKEEGNTYSNIVFLAGFGLILRFPEGKRQITVLQERNEKKEHRKDRKSDSE